MAKLQRVSCAEREAKEADRKSVERARKAENASERKAKEDAEKDLIRKKSSPKEGVSVARTHAALWRSASPECRAAAQATKLERSEKSKATEQARKQRRAEDYSEHAAKKEVRCPPAR